MRQQDVGSEVLDLCAQDCGHPFAAIENQPRNHAAAQDDARQRPGSDLDPVLSRPGFLQEPVVDEDLGRRVPELGQVPRVEVGHAKQAVDPRLHLLLVGGPLEPAPGIELVEKIGIVGVNDQKPCHRRAPASRRTSRSQQRGPRRATIGEYRR